MSDATLRGEARDDEPPQNGERPHQGLTAEASTTHPHMCHVGTADTAVIITSREDPVHGPALEVRMLGLTEESHTETEPV